MTASNFETNTFTGGLNMDSDNSVIKNDQYKYAENIRIMTNDSGTTGVLQNIEGVKKYNLTLADGEVVIGTTTINDIAVVFTRLDNSYTKVYKITDFNKSTPDIKVILKGDLNLCQDLEKNPSISVVSNYESENNIKVYFTDGQSGVKVLNIVDDKYIQGSPLVDEEGNILNPLALDLTPGSDLPPFKIVNLGIGNLPSGVVQYCYQLFNVHGSETVISPLSTIIHLTQSTTNTDSQYYMGSYPDTSSNKSCNITTDFISKDFDKCRIIRIQYSQNNETPEIIIVDEIQLLPTYESINYVDTGNSYLGTMTIDEFNLLSSYQFKASSIEKMQNRLFAANVTEETWDPGFYDARAYRCNIDGKLVLESSNKLEDLTFDNFDEADLSTIPEKHDCINPYNNNDVSAIDSSEIYAYTKTIGDTRVFGGSGLNIDYTFVTVPIILSETQSQWRLDDNCSMNVKPVQMNSILAKEHGTNSSETIMFNDTQTSFRQPNYADPYIASHFKGYQRDEVYRFGIIFYNNKSIPSPVYWIGDIKIPHAGQIPIFSYENNQLVGNAIGIKFNVRNLPEGAVSYEIVRCDRTESDRTVLMQGVMTNLYQYLIQDSASGMPGTGDDLDSSIEMRPLVFPEYGDRVYNYAFVNPSENAGQSIVKRELLVPNYIRFISPEVCVQQNDITTYFKDSTYIDCIGSCFSPINYTEETKIAAVCSKTLQSTGSIVSVRQSDDYARFSTGTYDNFIIFRLAYRKQESDDGVNYISHIFKYYITDYSVYKIPENYPYIKNAIYPQIVPYNALENISAYRANIGERTYTNFAVSGLKKEDEYGTSMFKEDNQVIVGPAGPCLILWIDDLRNYCSSTNTSISQLNTMDKSLGVVLTNIKRKISSAYGGNTYVSRQNSVYISTNSYSRLKESSINTTYAFGGDIYLGVLDYPMTFTFQKPDEKDYNFWKRYVGAYIPCESSINMNLFNGDMPHMTYTSENYIDPHMLMDVTQKGVYHVQEKPFFVYNSVYSSQQGSRKFVPKSIYDESNQHISNRILVSQAKTNNEILDSWTIFKTADYLDVDSQYGSITNLKKFKDRLFYFQDTAVGIAAVNERALITDDNIGQLTLGTGGILSRYDYITTLNGSSIINDRSIVNSDNILYWYDYDKNEICAYNGSVNQISKEKQVQSYLNEMYNKKRDVTLTLFDKKYNEVWFKFYDKSLVFNEQLGRFTSFYTFNPDWQLPFSDKIVTIKDNCFYIVNSLDTDGLGEVDKSAKIKFVVNKDYMYTKVFDNVLLSGEMLDQNGANSTNSVIDYMKFGTKHQESVLDNNITFDYREDTYRLPVPRQSTEDSNTYSPRLRGKYLTCEYHFDTNNEKTFKIPYITTTYRYSLV